MSTRSTTQDVIDHVAEHYGWAPTERPAGDANEHYTAYDRGRLRVVVAWTPAGRVRSYDLRENGVGVRFGADRHKRQEVLTILSGQENVAR
jgi:hypothetical protein